MEYVDLKESRKSETSQSQSASSESSRGVYRSADNFDYNRSNDGRLSGYNPQQSTNNLTEGGSQNERNNNQGSQGSPVFNKTNYTGSTSNKNSVRASNNLDPNYYNTNTNTNNYNYSSSNMYKSSTHVNTNSDSYKINPNLVSSTRQVIETVQRESQLRSSKSGNK